MDNKDIKILIKILTHKKRADLALLLKDCLSEVEQSGQFGSHWKSIISSFLIYAPIEQYYKLRELNEKDQEFILNSILDVYPLVDDAPEIKFIEFRILKEEDGYESKELSSYVGRTVRVFISYATVQKDKGLASNLKKELEGLGLEVFLAHEDINPSSDWQDAILEKLKSTDIFMPIITEDFSKSYWTDQESGIAFIEKKLILPIAVDGHVPYGFLGRYQAFRQKSELPIIADRIIGAIIQSKKEFAGSLLDSLIKLFAISYKYDDAGFKSSLLLKFDTMSAEQVNEIFRSILLNDQIYDAYSAQANIKELFEKYQHLLDKKLLERVKNKKELSLQTTPESVEKKENMDPKEQ